MAGGAVDRRQIKVCIGKTGLPVGTLTWVQQGRRAHSIYAYTDEWLGRPAAFNVSADLQLASGHQSHKAATPTDSMFHGALADTVPDAWGRRVIARDHAKRWRSNPALKALSELDYLLAVDDEARVGALRLREAGGAWLRSVPEGQRSTPPLIDLARIYEASRAVERGQETLEDLRYLQGKGTSLGGMRPKCSIRDVDGQLALGKFPSVEDGRSITRGEVLALQLARTAGVDTPDARIVMLEQVPVAVIRRFDRDGQDSRIPYQSAASLLQAARGEERSYVELADAIRSQGHEPARDLQQLWRRLVFNLLITNVDDHLQNHGVLHVSSGLWRLAPAFDLNPFPDKERESKTWLSEQDGPITDIQMLLARAGMFALTPTEALKVVAEVHAAVRAWRSIAIHPRIGLKARELDDFAPAFEHAALDEAARLLA